MVSTANTFVAALTPDAQGHPALANHRAQSATAINAWSSVLFGLPFAAAGVSIGLVALDIISSARKNAPDWVIGIFACMFFLAGMFLIVHGVHDVVRKAAYQRGAGQRPGEPWLYDFHWRREGISFSATDDMVKGLIAAVIWNAFLIPFGWVGLRAGGLAV